MDIREGRPEVRAVTAAMLRRTGYKVLEAREGREALQTSERHDGSIDLLFKDVVTPGMNGRGLAHQVLPRHPHVRVVYTSGYTECGIGDSREVGPDIVFIQKPFAPNVLLHAVQAVLDRN
jgi:CheY-like chemotaxis protein